MKTVSLAEAKKNFADIVLDIERGDEVVIEVGRSMETAVVMIPHMDWKLSKERKLGTLKDKGSVVFADDFYMTDEELISL